MISAMEQTRKIQCLRCKYYQVTYNPQIPHGCRKYQFQSATIPNLVVKRETGTDCQAYVARQTKSEQISSFDDDKLW